MKNLKTIIMVLGVILISSCNSNSKPNLMGTWQVIESEGGLDDLSIGTNYIFEKGSLTFSKDGFDNKANSVVTDSTFTWDNGSMMIEYLYSFDNDNLVVIPKGGTQKLILERK